MTTAADIAAIEAEQEAIDAQNGVITESDPEVAALEARVASIQENKVTSTDSVTTVPSDFIIVKKLDGTYEVQNTTEGTIVYSGTQAQATEYIATRNNGLSHEDAVAAAEQAVTNDTPQTQQTAEPYTYPKDPTGGTPYDDNGNLNPGWTLDENNNPIWVQAGYNDTTGQIAGGTDAQSNTSGQSQTRSIAGSAKPADSAKFASPPDWRFRITLAPKSNYLYNAPDAGILAPLKGKGVIFPYTPTISVGYTAQYDTQSITHSNFKMHNYQSSSVDNITVTGDFTAQDITEANYMLAVIHFCKSATKMFYGQDSNPSKGIPPPLLYLSGLGQYQFDNHPVVLTGFTYTLPNDVDYINAYPNGVQTGTNGAVLTAFQKASSGTSGYFRNLINTAASRLLSSGLNPGGAAAQASFASSPTASTEVTRVPTKINISLTFLPIITRNAISNEFSLRDYASGKLLRGSQNPKAGGGIW